MQGACWNSTQLPAMPSRTPLSGPLVELKLVVKEAGKLKGEYVIRMSLQVDAARKLAVTLTELADRTAARIASISGTDRRPIKLLYPVHSNIPFTHSRGTHHN